MARVPERAVAKKRQSARESAKKRRSRGWGRRNSGVSRRLWGSTPRKRCEVSGLHVPAALMVKWFGSSGRRDSVILPAPQFTAFYGEPSLSLSCRKQWKADNALTRPNFGEGQQPQTAVRRMNPSWPLTGGMIRDGANELRPE